MEFQTLDYIDEAYIILDKIKVKRANMKAKDYGFNENSDIINIMTFNEIDEFIKSIINSKDFNINSTVYFFHGKSKFLSIKYFSKEQVLILKDRTEQELLKKVKADFITSLSHEIRTPLSVAKGNIYILDDFIKEVNLKKNISKVKESLNKIERILDQLTLLSMAEFGSYVLKYDIFDPGKIFSDVISDLENKITNKKIKIDFISNVDYLKGDSFVIYTILRNLTSNAIKYSHENSTVKIIINKEKIVVEDNGIGIRDNEKDRIFERFYRGYDAKKYARGSGLGLSIVKYLCELAGYKIDFESKWQVGTKFTVYLT
ncbi:sensor histidine kinase [Marinitoga sp. 1155]|uniref:sensor histidine kinase n=1 Tax=Marinitoga sp. 1155 TaxID=1428448 RepID=UPI00064173D9|nr:HAMP domain-containing sensor histidine kinase [Marinitoga sp. 1155]KLO22165.1 histidine kinase [Marinitoga sp. 1155]